MQTVKRTHSSYLCGFQGQEGDDELKGQGNSVNYKHRMHDTRTGRFFAVDPLASEYPHNGPYNFSENMVIHAIELEGLEAFLIHGMNSSPDDWKSLDFKAVRKSVLKLANYKTVNDGFDWSGKGNGIIQTKEDRTKAAQKLVDYVLANKKEGEEITLIGASHGGNVSIQAAKMLGEKGYKVNIITINRTAFNEEGDSENPEGIEGINDFIDIRTENDKVYKFVRGGGAENEYDGPGQQLIISNDKKFFLNRHATKNIETEQIDSSDLKKLEPVPAEFNPPASSSNN